jgi:8-oxo-dGTP pyrophosphatase MutT (NUDIX family)
MWSVKSSYYPLQDRWISVRADDCVTSSGVELNPYYTFDYPDFVHVLAVTAERKVVLIRQYRHGFGGPVVELPGGMADKDDASLVAAGLRELREETGFTADRASSLPPLSIDPAKFRNRLHLVLVDGAVQSGARELDPSEDIEVLEATIPECIEMVRGGRFVNAAHIGMLMLGLDRLGYLKLGD